MSYNKKSGNGSILKRSSKKQKCKVTYPNISFQLTVKKIDWSKKKKVVNQISFKVDGSFVKKKIKKIVDYPIPSHRSHNYVVKNTVVQTVDGQKVKVTHVRSGALLGDLLNKS